MLTAIGDYPGPKLTRSPSPSRVGLHFWGFDWRSTSGSTTSFAMPVWGSELAILIPALDSMAELVGEGIDWPVDGYYPLRSAVAAGGGLIWLVAVRDSNATLALRRFNASFKPAREEDRVYTTYYQWARRGRFPIEVRVPWTSAARSTLGGFAEQCATAWEDALCRFALGSMGPRPPGVGGRELATRLVLRGQLNGHSRAMLADCGVRNPAEFSARLLADDATVLSLGGCGKARTPRELAEELHHELDERSLQQLVNWTVGYSESAMRAGFLAGPFGSGNEEAIVAVRDKSVFASDPLLMGLVGAPAAEPDPPSPPAGWVPSPQYKNSPFEAAIQRGWTAGVRTTALGEAPVPSEERTRGLRRLAKPTSAIARYRWKILQLLDVQAALVGNLATLHQAGAGNVERIVLETQRLALLINDAGALFDEAEDLEVVREIIEEARRSYWCSLSGQAVPSRMRQPRELPKRQRSR